MRRLGVILLAIAGLLAIAVPASFLWLRGARPLVDGALTLEGLHGPVEIWRDSLGVPHIWAESVEDMVFAQGFVHAQDRLWQMELFRRVAEGRLAEILGPDLVPTDRFLRNVGAWRAALPPADSEAAKYLAAYANGVNAWLEHRTGPLPPEFVILRFEPEPWTVRHSVAIEKVMAWDLSTWGYDAATARALRSLAPERARWAEPANPSSGPFILGAPAPLVPPTAAALLDAISVRRASNAWVIGGSRTASGKPILANDMHLALRAPGVWHLVALHGDGFDVAGMSLPGAPFVIAGHNRAVAWGFTNAMVDDVDLFVEQLDPEDSTRYLTPAGSEPVERWQDTIRVRGEAPVPIVIRSTRHGPIIDSEPGPASGQLLALRWAAHDPSNSIRAFPALNRARNAAELLAALRWFDNPHQNVVYADTAGAFGYRMAGRVPIRGQREAPTIRPVPGWTGEHDWTGWLPPDEHPQVHNPAAGFVVTANNRQAAGAPADLIATTWEPPFRARRITTMIENARVVTAADVHGMQLDVQDALAERYRPIAERAAQRSGLAAMLESLQSWDYKARHDSHAAALFYTWYEAFRAGLREDLFEGAGTLGHTAFHRLLELEDVPWLERGGAEMFDALAERAATYADSIARGRSYGDLHTVHAAHALSASPLLRRLLRLDIGHVPGNGSPTTVNVSQHGGLPFPVQADYGPSQRHVVDMADIDGQGGFILPGGQSGLPFDAHYRDQFDTWLNGGLWLIPLDRERSSLRTVHRLTLQPASAANTVSHRPRPVR
jgi:penicillin amidase